MVANTFAAPPVIAMTLTSRKAGWLSRADGFLLDSCEYLSAESFQPL